MKEKNIPVTFVVFSYNQAPFILQAVRSTLAQTYSPLEIIISDDCSSDETYSLIEKEVSEYNGPHKVVINKNYKNLGLIAHVNKVFGMASHELIIAVSGDDISLTERTQAIVDCYIKENNPYLIHSDAIEMDIHGNDVGKIISSEMLKNKSISEAALSSKIYLGATAAWSKKLFTDFGPITECNAYEDLVLGYRAILVGKCFHLKKPLLKYRVGSGISLSPSGTNIVDTIMKFRARHYLIMSATLNQRRADTETFYGKQTDLAQNISFHYDACMLAYHLYGKRNGAVLNLIRNPKKLILILFLESKWLASAFLRRIKRAVSVT